MALDITFFTDGAKPMPVILLLDTSNSMGGEKISTLNRAVETMINSFKEVAAEQVVIHLAVITFSSDASLYIPLQPVEKVSWRELSAGGGTNLAEALIMAKKMIEDRNVIPSRAYRPVVILVSDGYPFPGWEQPMADFVGSGRSQKCDRMAMLTGDNSAAPVMEQFLKGSDNRLFFANDANDISDSFRAATEYVMYARLGIRKTIFPGMSDEHDASANVFMPHYPSMPDMQTTITDEDSDLEDE